ncbi:MAG TPA: PASTA domain-containing protein [Actinomadura sp.]|jgi:hypothetical protein|nr:PASTA domain-containing protein [Actinomadura sp.]
MDRIRVMGISFAAGIVMVSAVGCGGATAGQAPAPVATVTVTSPAPNTSAAAPSSEPSSMPAKPQMVRVPNVVGKNHQLAQDLMQAQGLYNLREKDATGANRMLIIDRNWVVVSQSPKAGKRVSVETVVTLASKKIGE